MLHILAKLFHDVLFLGAVIRPQMMLNNFRHNTPPTTFPNPIQRPGLQIPTNQRPPRPPTNPPGPPPRPSTVPPSVVSTGLASSLKAQQEKQRQELLAHAQSFLNPQNKPSIKHTSKAEVSAGDKKTNTTTKPSGAGGSTSGSSSTKSDDGKASEKK